MNPGRRVAIVTGGNRGIGYEICKDLSRVGCNVVLTSRNEQEGRRAAAKLHHHHDNVVFRRLDVTDSKDISSFRDWILKIYGRVDILINNAGVYLDEGVSVFDVDENIMHDTLAVNFYGAFHMCRTFVPIMRQNGYGRIVNVSSGYGAMSEMGGYVAAYRISKASLNALTLIMANELRDGNIKVNAVCPGWVRTDMGGGMAPISPQAAAKDIVHFALVDAKGPTGGFFRHKKLIQW
ncbi:MAG: SDR family oxidoreductase [Thaumarchaeota archaeon]|nr:MAG: SDR family oxidoreductase [Nitrososphaerota archaeon]TLX87962.1 MAG: SDR family oxidoreductase [Nitrososphaerota archaeon]